MAGPPDVCTKCGTNLVELRSGERKTVRDLRADKEELQRQVRALTKQLARNDDRSGLRDHGYIRPLLSKLTDTFLLLEEAADPRRSTEQRAQMRYKRADSSGDEGASTRWARNLINEGIKDIRQWLNKVDSILEDEWTPPQKPPKGRCGNRECRLYDRWQKGVVGVPLIGCSHCLAPFSPGQIKNQPEMATQGAGDD